MQIQEFIGFIYEKYGNDSKRKVLSTQDLHIELSRWSSSDGVTVSQLRKEVFELKECMDKVKKILKSSTYNMSLFNIGECIKEVEKENRDGI